MINYLNFLEASCFGSIARLTNVNVFLWESLWLHFEEVPHIQNQAHALNLA